MVAVENTLWGNGLSLAFIGFGLGLPFLYFGQRRFVARAVGASRGRLQTARWLRFPLLVLGLVGLAMMAAST